MSTDYQRIASDNKARYGWDSTPIQMLAERLYTQRTHFVYELLQNAEDANATFIRFDLHQDRLEVRHDGTPFNTHDVESICLVGQSTKGTDLAKVGKFGIGFKSVYAYTRSPEIHSGGEHFRIQEYRFPEAVSSQRLEELQTTLFVLPLDHERVTSAQAFQESGEFLPKLGANTLLFLRRIRAIGWRVVGGPSGVYSREPLGGVSVGHGVLLVDSAGQSQRHAPWLLFERPIRAPEGEPLRVEIAYQLKADEGRISIVGMDRAHLSVFFPTERETHVGFLIQGPYRTTVTRASIPEDDPCNIAVVRETATLVVDTLRALRDAGMLDAEALGTMPLSHPNFPEGSLLHPIYTAVREALRQEPLLPAAEGRYVAGKNARIARGSALIDLFSPDQLGALLELGRPIEWLDREITQGGNTFDLYHYLTGTDAGPALTPEIDPEFMARRLSERFLRQQSDVWVAQLYAYLADQQWVWRVVKGQKIIRCEDDQLRVPFDSEGIPLVYLPPPGRVTYPIVKRDLCRDTDALRFLRGIGLTEPDPSTEILVDVIPLYAFHSAFEDIDAEYHDLHIEMIGEAMERSSESARRLLLDRLRETPFLRARNAATGEPSYRRPEEVYRTDPEVEVYFEGNPEAWLLDETSGVEPSLLDEFGVGGLRSAIRARSADALGHVSLSDARRDHRRGVGRFDPEASADGLEHALLNITRERAKVIWNHLLLPVPYLIRGTVQHSTTWNYTDPQSTLMLSSLGTLLTEAAWLPGTDGNYHRPNELSLQDLPSEFIPDDELAAALGMNVADISVAAQVTGLPEDDIRLLRAHPDEAAALLAQLRSRHGVQDVTAAHAVPVINFAEAVEEELCRPGFTEILDHEGISEHLVRNPVARRERVHREIEEEMALGPVQKRFARVPTSKWEAKENRTRHFLYQQYDGCCQICSSTFPKANGQPYFEGLYLVSRLPAQWLDRPGNVLSLCPTCCAKLQFGAVQVEDFAGQVNRLRLSGEGGTEPLEVFIQLIGSPATITYTEAHLLDLQELFRASEVRKTA